MKGIVILSNNCRQKTSNLYPVIGTINQVMMQCPISYGEAVEGFDSHMKKDTIRQILLIQKMMETKKCPAVPDRNLILMGSQISSITRFKLNLRQTQGLSWNDRNASCSLLSTITVLPMSS